MGEPTSLDIRVENVLMFYQLTFSHVLGLNAELEKHYVGRLRNEAQNHHSSFTNDP